LIKNIDLKPKNSGVQVKNFKIIFVLFK